MALVRMLYFCATLFDIHVMITHIPGTNNQIADALSRFQAAHFRQLALLAEPLPDYHIPSVHGQPSSGQSVHEYQSLGVAPSTHRTYQARVRSYQQFCKQYNVPDFPSTSLTLRYFSTSIAQRVSYKTIKVYLAGIQLEHLERGFQDPTNDKLLQLLCTGIKRSQGGTSRTRLPITVNILRTLKNQLQSEESYSLLEKRLLWSAFTLAFYAFLRASEFTASNLQWSDIHFSPTLVTIHLQQSKTDPFR